MTTVQNRLKTVINHPLFLQLYLPSFFFMLGFGMLTPIHPLYADDFGVQYELIGIFLAGQALGMLLGDVPAGMLLRRFGQRQIMVTGIFITTLATMSLFWAQTIIIATIYQIIAGFSAALFNVSRYEYIATTVTTEKRGRAIAMYGGIFRISLFIGPTVGAFIGDTWNLRTPYLVYGILGFITLSLVFKYVPDNKVERKRNVQEEAHFIPMLKSNYPMLIKAGSGQIFVQMLRSGTLAIIPLFGTNILHLDVKEIGFIMSALSGMNVLTVYPAGMVMDRIGRKYAIVPSFMLQTVGMFLIPFTTGFFGLLAATSLIGLANGLSAGTMMTIGADLAPQDNRGEFLGTWRLIGDAGAMGGPLIVGAIAGALALQSSALVIAGTGALAASVFGFLVPETLKKQQVITSEVRVVSSQSEPVG